MSAWSPVTLPRGGGCIRLERFGGRAEIAIDNPAARNALTPGMMADLGGIVEELEHFDAGVAVLIRGVESASGARAFCAGGHLGAVQRSLLDADAAAGMCAWMTGLLDRLAGLPMVVVAAVEGAALGGGAELLTVADYVVAGDDARIGFVHAALGVSPGWGGARRLVGRVGGRRAVGLLARAERLDPRRARDIGLVDEVVRAGEAVAAARRWLEPVEACPPEAVRGVVRAVREGDEAAVFTALWGGPAHRRALDRIASLPRRAARGSAEATATSRGDAEPADPPERG